MIVAGCIIAFLVGAVCSRWLLACLTTFSDRHSDDPWLQWRDLRTVPAWRKDSRSHPLLDRLPIVGWIRMRKREGKSIPRSWSVLECCNGLLFAAVYLGEVWLWSAIAGDAKPTAAGEAVRLTPQLSPTMLHLRIVWHLLLVECLLAAALIDVKHMIIPDGVALPAMLVGLVGAVAAGTFWLVPVWIQDTSVAHFLLAHSLEMFKPLIITTEVPADVAGRPHLHGLAVAVFGLVIGGGSVMLLRLVAGRALGEEAMGSGDVTLMAAVGAFLGWQPAVLITIGIAPLLALAVILCWPRSARHHIPFGPYLAAGTVLMLIFWPVLWGVGMRFFSFGALLLPVAIAMLAFLFFTLLVIRGVKRMLGWNREQSEWVIHEVWRPADQHHYVAGENDDDRSGNRDVKSDWPGTESGRGTAGYSRWRYGE